MTTHTILNYPSDENPVVRVISPDDSSLPGGMNQGVKAFNDSIKNLADLSVSSSTLTSVLAAGNDAGGYTITDLGGLSVNLAVTSLDSGLIATDGSGDLTINGCGPANPGNAYALTVGSGSTGGTSLDGGLITTDGAGVFNCCVQSSGFRVTGNAYQSSGEGTEITYLGTGGASIYAFNRNTTTEYPTSFGTQQQVLVQPSGSYGGTGNVLIGCGLSPFDNGNTLQVGGTASFASSVYSSGSLCGQGDTPPAAGSGIEIGYGGGGNAVGILRAYDRDTSAYIPCEIDASKFYANCNISTDDSSGQFFQTIGGGSFRDAASPNTHVLLADSTHAINVLKGETRLDDGAITTDGSGKLTVASASFASGH